MVSAIITAAGNGVRFGRNKMLAKLNGETILELTVGQFVKSKKVDEIVIAYKKGTKEIYQKLLRRFKKALFFVEGGEERIISANKALAFTRGEIVVTHDGVRPFVPVWLIDKVIEGAKKFGTAVPGVHPTTTIKYSQGEFVEKSLLRKETYLAQTPQAFKKEILVRAYREALKKKYFVPTDDAELVGLLGKRLKIIEGCIYNLKITFPEDLLIAKTLFKFIKKEL